MGRVFLIQKEGEAYTCAKCNVQVARNEDLLECWLNFYQFYFVYNVTIAQVSVEYHYDLYNGHEVSCVNCCSLLGWRDLAPPTPDQSPPQDIGPVFNFEHGRVAPPPENPPPPPPQD